MSEAAQRVAPRLWGRGLRLAVLASFAVAQPIFDLLGRQPEFLVAHRLRSADLILLTLVLGIMLPAAIVALWLGGRALPRPWGPRWDRHGEWLLIAPLSAAVLLPALKGLVTVLPGWMAVLIALACGCGVAVLLRRFQNARFFLNVLGPAVVLFPAIFLLSWPVRWLVLPPRIELGSATSTARVPVVMVVFDELSLPTLLDQEGQIDADRFPAFADLAASATWFPRATTVADSTFYGVPAILDGREPRGRRLPTFELYPQTLFSLLGGSHRLVVQEPLTSLCPEELCGPRRQLVSWPRRMGSLLQDLAVVYQHRLLPGDLTRHLPPVSRHWRNFGRAAYEEDKAARFARFLAAIRADDGAPALYFLHCMLPHAPWIYLPSGRKVEFFGTPGLSAGNWSEDEGLRLLGLQRYLLQLRFVDHLLGELLATLREVGLYDRALLVVTADHGVSFHVGNNRALHHTTFVDIMRVPLLIKRPGQITGERSSLPASTIDILPSISDLLGFEKPPWSVDGSSLFAADFPAREHKVVFQSLRGLGRRFAYPTTALTREATVAPLLRRFAPGRAGLFKMAGLAPELIGAPVEAAATRADPDGKAQILRPRHDELVYSEDPARLAPTIVIGRLRDFAGDPASVKIAVAVNGTVQAITGVYLDAEFQEARFMAMVPEASLIVGQNRMEAFVVR